VVSRIAQKRAGNRARAELVRGGGGLVGIAQAAKHTEVVIRRRQAEEQLVGRDGASGTTGTEIDKVRSRGQCFGPERGWDLHVKEHGAHAVVEGAQRALRSAWKCRGMEDVMRR
jgi:hypothetical protein